MATSKQSEPSLSVDRRQLLASVAVITTAGLAPLAESSGLPTPPKQPTRRQQYRH
jgi:hypothetical protein